MKPFSWPRHSTPAIQFQKTVWTYSELKLQIEARARTLKAQGIGKGERVAFVSHNAFEEIVNLWALWHLGATVGLLSPRLPQKEIQQQIQKLQCQTFKFSEQPRTREENKDLIFALENPATIMLTSGSSGEPKAVVHTLGHHYFNALGSNQRIPLKSGDRWLLSLPLYHVSGMGILWRCFLGGATVVLPLSKNIIRDIQHFRITHISLVTTQLIRLLAEKKNHRLLRNLKCVLLGGGPISTDLLKTCQKLKLPVYISYGLTEMGSQVATSQKGGRHVRVLPYRELKIKTGEICVRGKTLFKGYFKNKTLLSAVDQDGWFHTGDLGSYSTKQGLKVLGRKDNMFISGGENIYPEEIEKALLDCGIEQAVVIPKTDKIFGKRPVAFIKPLKNVAKLKNKLAKTLPKFKIPDQFLLLPTSIGIKPNRSQLLKRF